MRVSIFFATLLMVCRTATAQMWVSDSCSIRFFSHAPLEDIEALNSDGKSLINTEKNEMGVAVVMRGFRFKKALMQEHFNENYLESGKFPKATFKGKINEPVDWTKDGVYDFTATGILDIHGVPQPRNLEGKLTIKDGKASVDSHFKVKIADHKIKIPSVVVSNIAEEVDAFYFATFVPKTNEKK